MQLLHRRLTLLLLRLKAQLKLLLPLHLPLKRLARPLSKLRVHCEL